MDTGEEYAALGFGAYAAMLFGLLSNGVSMRTVKRCKARVAIHAVGVDYRDSRLMNDTDLCGVGS